MTRRRALITGITGQDGSYLAELLLEKDYEVHGLVRRSSSSEHQTWRIDPFKDMLWLHEGDMTDGGCLSRLVASVKPQEVYNLAAQTHVATSFEQGEYTAEVNGLGAAKLLDACRLYGEGVRFYQASTSEMFGAHLPPQHEGTPFWPRSPYGAAKLYAHWMTINAREAYGLHASTGILFNHESPRRGANFVTRKISMAVVRIKLGVQTEKLKLGNLDAQRDWGHAKDYVRGMWLMLQQDQPGDYVLATGQTRTVRELVDLAFKFAGLNWEDHVEIDPTLHRPAEVHALRGDARKAERVLGWKPAVSFEALVHEMVENDTRQLLGRAKPGTLESLGILNT